MVGQLERPFAFETASQHFAAGVYQIRMEDQHILLIRGVSESGMAMTSVEDNGQLAPKGAAVFQKYGNRYFLSEISVAGKSRRIHLQQTKQETQSQVAQDTTAPTSVEIALLAPR